MEIKKLTTLGPDGTYASQGVKKYFSSSEIVFVPTISDILVAGARGGAIVLPLENSIEGTVRLSWDGLLEKRLFLSGIFGMSIRHALGTKCRKLSDVKIVVSHPQAISQCRKFIDRYLKGVKIEYVGSTAEAVKKAASSRGASRGAGVAAIASPYACELYGLPILRSEIEDEKGNVTIFGVAGKKDLWPESRKDEMHVMVTPRRNMAGVLFGILKPFNDYGIDLTRLESRPTRKKMGEYRFLLSFKAGLGVDASHIVTILKVLKKNNKVDVLGASINF